MRDDVRFSGFLYKGKSALWRGHLLILFAFVALTMPRESADAAEGETPKKFVPYSLRWPTINDALGGRLDLEADTFRDMAPKPKTTTSKILWLSRSRLSRRYNHLAYKIAWGR